MKDWIKDGWKDELKNERKSFILFVMVSSPFL